VVQLEHEVCVALDLQLRVLACHAAVGQGPHPHQMVGVEAVWAPTKVRAMPRWMSRWPLGEPAHQAMHRLIAAGSHPQQHIAVTVSCKRRR
jgi:hypothetical protein